jgi:hypothetical protein
MNIKPTAKWTFICEVVIMLPFGLFGNSSNVCQSDDLALKNILLTKLFD